MSGNIVTTVSDQYAQFLLLQNLNNKNSTNSEIYHQYFKKVNHWKTCSITKYMLKNEN